METGTGSVRKESRGVAPVCSVAEDAGLVTVMVEMPGVAKEDLEIRVEGNELSIRGARDRNRHEGLYLIHERGTEPFAKTFTLDDSIDRENIDAAFANGMLALRLKVKEAAKPRKIEIA